MTNFKGTYYNGTSSKSNDVLFTINNDNLKFIYNSNYINWDLNNCLIQDNTFEISIKFLDQTINVKNNLEELKGSLKHLTDNSFYNKILKSKLYVHLTILVSIIGMLYLANQHIIPPLAEKAVPLIPKSFDNTIGESYFNDYSKLVKIDTLKTKTLNKFKEQLKLNNPEKINLYVVTSNQINAFCLPNGSIIIYTGILNIMDNENELIALLGHEIAHYNNRHSIKSLIKSTSSYMFLSILTNDMASITGVMADNINMLQNLSFSRKQENEADTEGLDFILKNNANPKGMYTLFNKLSDESNFKISEILSTHPDAKKRAKKIENYLSNNKNNYSKNPTLHRLFVKLKNE